MNKCYLQLGMLLCISFALWWSSIAQTFSLALNDDQYTHILIIVPISLVFIFLDRKKLYSSVTKNSIIFAGILFAASLAALFLSRIYLSPANFQLTLSMAGCVFWWLASFMLCFGLAAFQTFLFPLCFLFWIVPWPQVFLDWLIQMLQQYSTAAVDWMFQLVGIPVLRNGVILSIPGLTIEVAKECSSIRSSLVLLVSSMMLAQLLLRTKWRKVLVILVSIPLSVVKNAIRIFTLSMLGLHVNRGFLTGRLHHEGGAVFYAGALVLLILFTYLLQRQESPPSRTAVLTTE
jgi:exosortase